MAGRGKDPGIEQLGPGQRHAELNAAIEQEPGAVCEALKRDNLGSVSLGDLDCRRARGG